MGKIKRIQILGKEGPDTWALMSNAKKAARRLRIHNCTFELISKDDQIMRYGVFILPGLATDGNVRVIGRIAEVPELIRFFEMILQYQELDETSEPPQKPPLH